MIKVLKIFSYTVIFLFVLAIFGWMSIHIAAGDKKFGFLDGPVKFMYSFPDMFKKSLEEVKGLSKTFIPTPTDFVAVNELEEDLIILTSYSDEKDSRTIVLKNLRNDSILYSWNVENPYEDYDRILNPVLLPGKELVFSFHGKSMMRIDSMSNIVWQQTVMDAHHSAAMDSFGHFWTCTFEPVFHATAYYFLNGRKVFFKDNAITQYDVNTGDVIFNKSFTKILLDNGLESFIIKAAKIDDPIHLNDIQPALKTTEFYNEGDLFISARQLSLIMQYRPSTNEVIRMIEGPFVAQHDVDFYGDSAITLFNNNAYVKSSDGREKPADSCKLVYGGDFYSNIVKYNFATEEFSFIGDSVFRANKIYTMTEGLFEFIATDTYFVEEQNSGELWVIKDDKVIYKNVMKSQHEGYHHLPNWTRVIRYGE